MKIFVTKEYLQECSVKIKELQQALEAIRQDKNTAFEGDTNTWHDNFAYENATREEKMAEDRLLLFDEALMTFTMGNCITLEDTNGNRKLFKKRFKKSSNR